MLQSLNHLHCPPLDLLQYVHDFLELGSHELDLALQMWLQQCQADGKVHLSQPSGNAFPNAYKVLGTTNDFTPFLHKDSRIH